MTHRILHRRALLKASGFAAAGLALSPFLGRFALAADDAPRKKILFFTKSAGFQHAPITRKATNPEELGLAERILSDLGAAHGFDITCSKDGSLFTRPDEVARYDAFAFYTTGDLREPSDKYTMKKDANGKATIKDKLIHPEQGMGQEGKDSFLAAIKDAGKGFIGFHSATDTCHSKKHVKGEMLRDVDESGKDAFDPYIQMIGGEFIIHGKQQNATLRAIDPKFPGASAFDGQKFVEEWYSLKNFSPDLHVILAQDCSGMEGAMYQRQLFPETWARMHGKGRVFYTSMGHRDDVWQKPEFANLVVNAMGWITGRIQADVTPNIKQATPAADPATSVKPEA